MFEDIKAAGINPTNLAKLASVTRVTASYWLHGHTVPAAPATKARVDALLAEVRAALKAGSLPLPHTVPSRKRFHALTQVLAQYRTS
jgi:hypothetical protein